MTETNNQAFAWFLGAVLVLSPATSLAQDFTQRGFVESRAILYPQKAPNDNTQAVGDALFRYEAAVRMTSWLSASGGIDARADTHDQVDRAWRLDWDDRGMQRPALSVRKLDATIHVRPVTFQLGKQFVRWGKADILNPTDLFAPRDFLAVVDNDFLAVTAARTILELGSDTIDIVWAPRVTPSRIPLLDQRWTRLSPEVQQFPLRDLGGAVPGGSQVGARWNHTGPGFELSLSGFRGVNPLPIIDAQFVPLSHPGSVRLPPSREASADRRSLGVGGQADPSIVFSRAYPRIGMIGGDGAVPLRWFTIKAEAAYFTTSTAASDEYVLYVVQFERLVGEWNLVGGYAGEVVTTTGARTSFSPQRGLGRSFLGRAGYTFDATRSVALEGAVRQNGRGSWLKGEYSRASGQHLRATVAATWIRGQDDDFLGQFRLNSHATVTLRYSF